MDSLMSLKVVVGLDAWKGLTPSIGLRPSLTHSGRNTFPELYSGWVGFRRVPLIDLVSTYTNTNRRIRSLYSHHTLFLPKSLCVTELGPPSLMTPDVFSVLF